MGLPPVSCWWSRWVFNSYHGSAMNQVTKPIRVHADFDGLFSELLCPSHEETCRGEDGQPLVVGEGMTVTAFDEDLDGDSKPDDLIASGTVKNLGSRGRVKISA